MVQNVNIDVLVANMKGTESTNKWDVLCSYSIKQLNDLLSAQYQADRLIKEISFSTEGKIGHRSYTVDYMLIVSAPKLSFHNDNSGIVTLEMPVMGGNYTTKEEGYEPDVDIIKPGEYTLKCTVPLAAMVGDTSEVHEAQDIISFADGRKESAHITLHFQNSDRTTFEVVAQDPKSPLASDDDLPEKLSNWAKKNIKEIDYSLATINNHVPNDKSISFTPQSFIFVAYGDSADNGVLSLYIQIKEYGTDKGDPKPSFQGGSYLPIPESFNASLILSYNLMVNVLKSQTESIKDEKGNNVYSSVAPIHDNNSGIKLQLVTDKSFASDAFSTGTIIDSIKCGPVNINISQTQPITVLVTDKKMSASWQGNGTIGWREMHADPQRPDRSGEADISASFNQDIAISIDDYTINPINFVLDKSKITHTYKVHKCEWWDNGCTDLLPSHYNDLTFKDINIEIKIPGLDFFLTTNLLSPGQQIIKFDTAQGFKVPKDVLLVGKMTTSTQKIEK